MLREGDTDDPPTEIDGGWRVKMVTIDGEPWCIDVLAMMFNYRVVLSRRGDGHPATYERGYCYFGHGTDARGHQRTMKSALLAAMAAASMWDGHGDPPGFDKRVGS